MKHNLLPCPYCESVNIDNAKNLYCRNCKAKITSHEKQSLSSAWAMLLSAIIFYVIANLYPILEINKLTTTSHNTIIGGVISLWNEGSYPIAIIIFTASVFVPLLKFIMIIYILTNYKKPQIGSKKIDQERLYHIAELIGPWSMIDVFVVAILAGVVNMHSVKIYAGVGATAFVLMVFFTLLSTLSIDHRLIKEKE